jgi:hypothetical protein
METNLIAARGSRTPTLWGTWQADTGHYSITDGDCAYSVRPAHVVALRRSGAEITCYGGPLDHRNPTAEKGAYDQEIAAMRA